MVTKKKKVFKKKTRKSSSIRKSNKRAKNKTTKKKSTKKKVNKKASNKKVIKKVDKPVLLMIMDGFGIRKPKKGNAVKQANMPFYDSLLKNYPHSKLNASERSVGLPKGQMGNSEVGHMTIGSGRIIETDLVHINKKIRNKKFFQNATLNQAIKRTKKDNSALHLMGLLSDGGVHSHINHLFALLKLAKQHKIKKVYIHCFLDGRDVPPKSAKKYIVQLDNYCRNKKVGKIASLIGRFYGMDRDNRWVRENKAYSLIVEGIGRKFFHKPLEALNYAYNNQETDEFVKPTLIDKEGLVKNNDTIIFFNFRSDRAREISKAFTIKKFHSFRRKFVKINFICLTMYNRNLKLPIAFPPRIPTNTIGEVVSRNKIKQLRIAETEKYPHITFFFNGTIETPYNGEDRILIPSPKVLTYDLKPEMSAPIVSSKLIDALKKKKYKFIVLNFANPDMVGHSGSLRASKKALEVVDPLIEKIVNEIFEQDGSVLLIADHGNCEQMFQTNGTPHTAHTLNKVPCILINKNLKSSSKKPKLKDGSLKDVAPTLLELLDIFKPKEMTGHSLITLKLKDKLKE
jgi:2,3-bisphosphoglycerate-independent phosphoglycerate mutase